jgi:hypothetical protein
MFIYPTNEAEKGDEAETKGMSKAELHYKWLMFQRFFRQKTAGRGKIPDEPVIQVLLRHFYDAEIGKRYKFDEIELVNSIRRNLFHDFDLRNIAD